MTDYTKLNRLCGWIAFSIATVVYMLTIEPTTSWWDCGEYISTAFKLQVGHPPGAPLFQILGRFFSLFAFGDVSKVALMVNTMSALSSSFTILFLFWSITMLAKKITLRDGDLTQTKTICIMGSGFVGALAYTFSDSFWFSAVEGEVYAMSSFFTALVFWAILKWEENADKATNYRWLILIAYLMGLSIGVHLLNLLAIPAITFVYYYKKYKTTRKGIVFTGIISVLILAVIMYLIIPGIVELSTKFELFFVNSFGLPFNSGTLFYFLLLTGLIIWGLRYTLKKEKQALHAIVLSLLFILIGYSSFIMLIIRANANTPINENNPDDAISLLSYLNREQYGTWPLFHGQYYNAPVIDANDGNPVYIKDRDKGKYVIADARKNIVRVYDPRFTTVFPRMWSDQNPSHIEIYKEYITGRRIAVQNPDGTSETLVKPTFADNLRFFFSYQLGYMYFRYFMWNFAGRQNDLESQGDPRRGNWISGIGFIDKARIGNYDKLPDAYKGPAHNKFYLLPLILGVIGFFFHINKHKKDAWVVSLLFIMTGIAIVVYLNQSPVQPRERDYAYAGSFYAFAIWIGLGAMSLVQFIFKYVPPRKIYAIVCMAISLMLVPGIMASEGWDDHKRSGKYAARDFAFNYFNSCSPNSVIYTIGDNDTFPLWYAQEVENYRTDIRVVNYMLSSGEWYVHQLARKIYDAEPLSFTLTPKQYDKGKNQIVYYSDRGVKGYTDLKDVINFIASEDPRTKATLSNGEQINYIPAKKFKLKVDSAAVVENGIVPKELAHLIVPEITWEIKRNVLYKNDLAFLDFLANNNWKRPIYFTNPSVVEDVFNVPEYFHLEGIAYKFMPVKARHFASGLGGVSPEISYDVLLNNSNWGNLNDPAVSVDRESMRNVTIIRQNFMRVTTALMDENKADSAVQVADKCFEVFPPEKFPIDYYSLPFIEVYFEADRTEKALEMSQILFERYKQEIEYYLDFNESGSALFDYELRQSFAVMQRLGQLAREFKQDAFVEQITDLFEEMQIAK